MDLNIPRCWKTSNPVYIKYHDEEWGVPNHDDNKLFEFLVLGGFQAGLTWEMILNKRESFRSAFDNFDPKKISHYSDTKIIQLLNNSNLIRNKAKIIAAVNNSKLVLEIQSEYGSFDKYMWSFASAKKDDNNCNLFSELPTETDESKAMSKELKDRGFKFVGPKICYAFMQAVGMVNDHLLTCFRRKELEFEQ